MRVATRDVPGGRARVAAGTALPAASDAPAVEPETSRKPGLLPPFKLVLHNDDVNDFAHVIQTIIELTPLEAEEAVERTIEAHETGHAVLLVTSKERAELYVEQFASKNLTTTCEPDC